MNENMVGDHAAYWDDRIRSRPFTLAAVAYDGLAVSFLQWQYKSRLAAVRRWVGSVQGLDVLDVGSGTGFWVGTWLAAGAGSVHGLDISPVAVNHLRQKFNAATFSQADIARGMGLDSRFDLVSAVDVLQHVTDDDGYLASITHLAEACRPGGRLLLVDAIADGPAPTYSQGQTSRVWSRPTVEQAMGHAGFEVVVWRPVTWLLNGVVETTPSILTRVVRQQWRVLQRLARYAPVGGIVGAVLYAPDQTLSRLRWGPSTKLIIARRR